MAVVGVGKRNPSVDADTNEERENSGNVRHAAAGCELDLYP